VAINGFLLKTHQFWQNTGSYKIPRNFCGSIPAALMYRSNKKRLISILFFGHLWLASASQSTKQTSSQNFPGILNNLKQQDKSYAVWIESMHPSPYSIAPVLVPRTHTSNPGIAQSQAGRNALRGHAFSQEIPTPPHQTRRPNHLLDLSWLVDGTAY